MRELVTGVDWSGDDVLGDSDRWGVPITASLTPTGKAAGFTVIVDRSGIVTLSGMPCCLKMARYCSTVACRPAMSLDCRAITLFAWSNDSVTSRRDRVMLTLGLFLIDLAHAPNRIVENVSAVLNLSRRHE